MSKKTDAIDILSDPEWPKLTLGERIYYPLCRAWDKIDMFPRQIKWFIQRGRRGWADCDIWGLDFYLAGWLPKALRRLADITIVAPCDFFPLHDEMEAMSKKAKKAAYEAGHKQWHDTIIKMAEGFEAANSILNDEYFVDGKWDKKKQREFERTFHNGMKLFTKHFFGLWD